MSIDIIELVIFIVIVMAFGLLTAYALTIRIKMNKISNQLAQEVVDKIAIATKFAKLMSEQNMQNLQQSDGFIKFLSDSRDSAFKYIEDVQKELKDFMNEVGPVIEAYRVMPIKTSASETIVKAYDKLIKIMPEEIKNN